MLKENHNKKINVSTTQHNTHKRQISMPPVGFEPAIPASERPQTNALDPTVIRILLKLMVVFISN